MKRVVWLVGLVQVLGLLTAVGRTGAQSSSAGPTPVMETPKITAPLEIPLGPCHLSRRSGVIVKPPSIDSQLLRQSIDRVIRSLAPAAPTTPTTHFALPLEAIVHWTTPGRRTFQHPLRGEPWPLPELEQGVHHFYVVWSDPVLGFEMRIPQSPRAFEVEVEGGSAGADILDGSGTMEGVFGESIPVWVKVSNTTTVRSATVFTRSSPQGKATTIPMALEAGPQEVGTFRGRIPRPLGSDATLEYWIVLEDQRGRLSSHGSVTTPNRIQLKQPAVDQ